ncbi:hypothetical protein ABK040_001390 [Willaertia magna]
MRVVSNLFVLAIVAIIACLLVGSSMQALQRHHLYQGTTCAGTPFFSSTKEVTAQCNVTQCGAYNSDPTLLSVTYECPTAYQQTPSAGQILIASYADKACTTINKVETYMLNVCMQSKIIFGPNANSAKYTCDKLYLYSDGACATQVSVIDVTLNTCTGSSQKYTCQNAATQTIASFLLVIALFVLFFAF